MNWDDFKFLLSPGEGVQAPILNRAIGLAKNEQDAIRNKVIPNNLKSDIEGLLNSNSEEIKKRQELKIMETGFGRIIMKF